MRWFIAAALILSPITIAILSSAKMITSEQSGAAIGIWTLSFVIVVFRWLIFGENNLAE